MHYFVWSIRNAFHHPMYHILYDVMSNGMCSFILCVICCILSCPFGLRFFIRYGISFLLSCPPGMCFISCVDYVLFCLRNRNDFYHPICHRLYIVISTCDVAFHAKGPGFILFCAVASRSPSSVSYVLFCHVHLMCSFIQRVLCITLYCLFGLLSTADVSLCVIMSCPSEICYFIPCSMFSDCYVHHLTWRVDSTRRAKCTITICTQSDVVIRYAPTPLNPRNI